MTHVAHPAPRGRATGQGHGGRGQQCAVSPRVSLGLMSVTTAELHLHTAVKTGVCGTGCTLLKAEPRGVILDVVCRFTKMFSAGQVTLEAVECVR